MRNGRISKPTNKKSVAPSRTARRRRTRQDFNSDLSDDSSEAGESTAFSRSEQKTRQKALGLSTTTSTDAQDNNLPPMGSFTGPKRLASVSSASGLCSDPEMTTRSSPIHSIYQPTDRPPTRRNEGKSEFNDTDDETDGNGIQANVDCDSESTKDPAQENNKPGPQVPPSTSQSPNHIMANYPSWMGPMNLGKFSGPFTPLPFPFMFPPPPFNNHNAGPVQASSTCTPVPPSLSAFSSNASVPPAISAPMHLSAGSWCQVIGPGGQPVMAWVPSATQPQNTDQAHPSRIENQGRPSQNFELTSYEAQREHLINEQNKERLRIREMRRAETLRRYMQSSNSKGISTAQNTEHADNGPSSENYISTEGETSSAKDSEEPAHSTTVAINPGTWPANQLTPLAMRMDGWQRWPQQVQFNTNQTDQPDYGAQSAGQNSHPFSQNVRFKKNVYLQNAHKLYGKSQPRSYGYGDIIPQSIEHKNSATPEDHDRALKMLSESFDAYKRKREKKVLQNGPSKEELAESAALLANYNRASGMAIRNVAHRKIEEEYAKQRREFHDVVDALQMPAIQNSDERWVCALCPENSPDFLYYKHLLRHAAHHLEIKPFKCPFCSRCFRRSDTARRHQLSCVQLSMAVKERSGAYPTPVIHSSTNVELSNKPVTLDSETVTGQDDDETSEEELEESDNDTQVGDSSNVTSKTDQPGCSIPPVVMPIQE